MTTTPDFWLDAHLDLAYMALERTPNDPNLEEEADPSRFAITQPALHRGRVRLCFATIFTAPGEEADEPWGYQDHEDREGAHRAGMRQLEIYEDWEAHGRIRIARTREDLLLAETGEGPPTVVILMECADPIRTPQDAEAWVERGVRMVGMSWSHGSRYSGGNGRPGGLTGEGREFVQALDALGVAHDVSHLSDESVDDLLALSRGPIASTHSNVRRLMPENKYSIRHLRQDHAAEIAARGGVAGLNLFGRFLAADRRATLEDVVAHAEGLAESFGRLHVGLGSDADGGFGPNELPEGIEAPERFDRILESLGAAGWTKEECASFRWGAWRSFLDRVPAFGS
jgi:membrane dipeptidase